MRTVWIAGFVAVALQPLIAFADVLALTDGTRIEIQSYEVRESLVVFTTSDGRLQSLPVSLVDLETTERLNQPGTGDTVSLRFGWSEGMKAEVTSSGTRERIPAAPAGTFSGSGTYTLSVEAHPEGWLIRYHDFELGALDTGDPTVQGILKTVSAMAPSYVVDPEGNFVRPENIGQMKADIDRLLEPLWAALPEERRDQMRSFVGSILTEQTLAASAAEEWNALVGAWIGGDLEIGRTYELSTSSPVPFDPDLNLSMRHEFSAAGFVPCEAETPEKRCVHLRALSFPDADGLKALVENLLKRVGESAEQMLTQMGPLDARTEVNLIAEPDGLIPRSIEIVKDVRSSVGPEGTKIQQIQRRTMRYAWQGR